MKINTILLFFLLSFFNKTYSQNESYVAIYPDSLKENANAIIKENLINITIPSFDKMNVKTRRVITIFNEYGLKHMNAQEHFDKSTTINNIEAKIYNQLGVEIKKIKKKDFKESALSQGSIITDNRVLYLEYVPIQYPFTLIFESETTTSNTAFIPSWSPIEAYFLSTVKSEIIIDFAEGVKFKYKEYNFDKRINKKEEKNHLEFSANNIVSLKGEQLSPSIRKFVPYVMFGLDEFYLEGVKGYANDWNTFGKWMYDNLLSDTEEIPVETKQKIKDLIGEEKNHIEIAKIIYKYVQDKTRYVSIQLGIGGWRPMLAKDVDRLGYGDCKALTNYTRSLLKTFNIPSYYAVVYGDNDKRSIEEDFVSMQGNHVILGIPKENEIIWLECTSQIQPFGFQGNFTDDRNVLVVSKDKSEIVSTKDYNEKSNKQITKAKVEFSKDRSIQCEAEIFSHGIIYDEKFMNENKSQTEIVKYYKENLNHINNISLTKNVIRNDKKNIELKEELSFNASDYVMNSGDRFILPINVINPISFVPKRHKDRKNPFEVSRGYYYEDEIEISIPKEYVIESIPDKIEMNSDFGEYFSTVTKVNDNRVLYKRTILIKKGFFKPEMFEDYRAFREQIARNENSKLVIINNQ
ncbi:DUF3857 domain-containing protein [uncultured Flavobacterium sp.]|uniref:DUF3857 domain-containing protein n=1 Tax=uncultured Flavobacterium sp. TaxID=165435 RepID=UPI0030C89097